MVAFICRNQPKWLFAINLEKPRIVVKAPNTTQFTRAKCLRTHHNLSNNKFDMMNIHTTDEI